MSNIISLHVVSRGLLLLRLGKRVRDSYWSLMGIDGKLVGLGKELE